MRAYRSGHRGAATCRRAIAPRAVGRPPDLLGHRTNYILTASRWPIEAVVKSREFEVPYLERVLATVIDVDGEELELVNTHVPDGSSHGWRKVEHFEGL
jgi:hypothetical protein